MNSFISLSFVNGVKETGPKEKPETAKDAQLEFISPIMLHAGTDLKIGKFSFSPRLILTGKQKIAGVGDTTRTIIRRQTIDGYALLNLSFKYNFSNHCSAFANITNALNQQYRCVSFNMDLTKKDTELYYGQPQDPIRVMCGFNFNF